MKWLVGILQELKTARLTNESSSHQAELSGLTISLMYEACLGPDSRSGANVTFTAKHSILLTCVRCCLDTRWNPRNIFTWCPCSDNVLKAFNA